MPRWVVLGILLSIVSLVAVLVIATRRFIRYTCTLPQGAEHLYGCAECGGEITQMPGTQTDAFPGFICTHCGLKMRPPRSTALYLMIMILSIVLSAAFLVPLAMEAPQVVIGLYFVPVLVVYALIKLYQPKPKLVEPLADSDLVGH